MPVAQRLLERIQLPVPIDGGSVRVAASIGIAISSADCPRADQLVSGADRAMYQAKSWGGDTALFEDEGS